MAHRSTYRMLATGLLSLCLTQVSFATAQSHQSANSIMKTAEAYIKTHTAVDKEQTLIVKANKLDPRLRLPKCSKPIEAFLPHGQLKGKNRTIGVRCESQRPWKIFVPVKVKIMSPAVVLTRRLNPGDDIDVTDVSLQTRDVSTMAYGYFSDLKSIQGYTAKRSLANGTLLSPEMLKAPLLIQRGQTVTIAAESGSLSIKMNGKAMSDGSKGDIIRVKNLNSGRIVEGVVQNNGSVKINF